MQIDWARLHQLQEDVGTEDIRGIITLFEQELKQVIAQLPLEAEPAQMANNLHYLKGCALNLGFNDLARLCQQSFDHLNTDPAPPITLAPILECYESATQALRQSLDDQLGGL